MAQEKKAEEFEDKITQLAFKILSEKGIDHTDLSMFGEKAKKIYDLYGDKFMNQEGVIAMTIAVKSFIRSGFIEKAKKKLLLEGDRAIKEREYNYALLCYRLLGDDSIVNFLLSNNFNSKDSNIDYSKVYSNIISYIQPGLFQNF
ncbi:hypothetical protein HYX19_02955 [Candidatus Woesearchaeota archaeon]|nr:hypothetical protein [Candidatus Woesearchaeota archaeon]